jgi:hypothetical protein
MPDQKVRFSQHRPFSPSLPLPAVVITLIRTRSKTFLVRMYGQQCEKVQELT